MRNLGVGVRVAVAGSRSGVVSEAEAKIFARIWRMVGGTILLHGCCPAPGTPRTDGVPERMAGVDAWVEERARARGIPIEHFPPKQLAIGWPMCGPERNRRMVRAADVVVVFPGGKGTRSTAGFALEQAKPLYEIAVIDGVAECCGPCPNCGLPGDGYGCECALL